MKVQMLYYRGKNIWEKTVIECELQHKETCTSGMINIAMR